MLVWTHNFEVAVSAQRCLLLGFVLSWHSMLGNYGG